MTREEYMEKFLKKIYNTVTNFKAYHPEERKPEKQWFCTNKISSKHKQRKNKLGFKDLTCWILVYQFLSVNKLILVL